MDDDMASIIRQALLYGAAAAAPRWQVGVPALRAPPPPPWTPTPGEVLAALRRLGAGAYTRPLFGSTKANCVGQGVFKGCLGGIYGRGGRGI
jgi:hypothetical protein